MMNNFLQNMLTEQTLMATATLWFLYIIGISAWRVWHGEY